MLHKMFERSYLYELERYTTTLENKLAKPSKVKNKHMLRCGKSTLLQRAILYMYVYTHTHKDICMYTNI